MAGVGHETGLLYSKCQFCVWLPGLAGRSCFNEIFLHLLLDGLVTLLSLPYGKCCHAPGGG
jgi:hypothetical protein